jgi:peptide/nickel transport system ATP-binding protein
MTLLKVRDLRVSYDGRTVAEVPRLDVERGRIVGVVGESGSGKSTTAWAILGLARTSGARVTGSIVFDGQELVGARESRLRELRGRRITMITQSPRESLNPTMRLGTLFERTLRLHGVPRKKIRQRAVASLAEVHLGQELLRRYPNQISGGQAQRFTIALVLALGSDLVLADEPTSALDVTVQAEVVDLLRRLRDVHGTSVMLISHDLALVGELADDVVVMWSGAVVEAGRTTDVLGAPQHDHTKALVDAVPRIRGSAP